MGTESLKQFSLSSIKGGVVKGNTLIKDNITGIIKHRFDFPHDTAAPMVSLSGVLVTAFNSGLKILNGKYQK